MFTVSKSRETNADNNTLLAFTMNDMINAHNSLDSLHLLSLITRTIVFRLHFFPCCPIPCKN